MSSKTIDTKSYPPEALSSCEEIEIKPRQYAKIMDIQRDVLSMLSSGIAYDDILKHLCHLAEELLNNSVASLMLMDETTQLMNPIAAPSIPPAGKQALKGLKPGTGGGSCGNAVFQNTPVYVQNTFEDKRWEDIRNIAVDFNICSCWSMPIRDEEGNAFGSFALSSFEHREPSAFHKLILETSAYLIQIVLKKASQDKLQRASFDKLKLFATVAEHAMEGMIITNANNEIIEVNSACKDIFGYSEAEIIGNNPKMFASGEHDDLFYKDMWRALKKDGHWTGEVINKRRNGTNFAQWISISLIPSQHKEDRRYVAVFTDISELKKTQEQLRFIAYHDPLTALSNNNSLQQKLHENNKEKTLVLLNIDNFHYLNTVYGFSFGDLILKEVAGLLKECTREDEVFRSGGDEFALLLQNTEDIKPLILSMQEMLLNHNLNIKGIKLNISFSYGVADGKEKLYEHAVLALKMAKERGKNQFYIYNKKRDSVNKQKKEMFITWSKRLYDALDNSNIIPYFQGIRDNTSGEIYKFEVLARLIYQDEVISPYHFIEPAKLAGLLPRVTRMIIDKSFSLMQNYDYSFSINISEEDLNANYLLAYLKQKIKLYNILPSRITLEILEGISDTTDHVLQLTKLKAEGFSLAIDDFGAEYSNFGRILDLEIDYLKIDAKYIKNIHTDKKSYEITRSIAYFAKNTNIKCIAEHVHSPEVQDVILALEIDYSQGYLYSEPNILPKESYIV